MAKLLLPLILMAVVTGCATPHHGAAPAVATADRQAAALFLAPAVDSHWASASHGNDADDLTFAPLIEASVLALENWLHSRRNASSLQLAGDTP